MLWRIKAKEPNRLQSKGLSNIKYMVIIPLLERIEK
nr:MAG TPA: hypothetical protein [Caudoviricetes sp.]